MTETITVVCFTGKNRVGGDKSDWNDTESFLNS